MGLTWKDAVTTVFMGAIAVVSAAFLGGTNAWLISSARGATLAVLVMGGALWLIATSRHALMAPHGPARTRDNHGVINSRPAARR
jgi:hypothetical protein